MRNNLKVDLAGAQALYRSSISAPFAANSLELLISKGARYILFLNGGGSAGRDLTQGGVALVAEGGSAAEGGIECACCPDGPPTCAAEPDVGVAAGEIAQVATALIEVVFN